MVSVTYEKPELNRPISIAEDLDFFSIFRDSRDAKVFRSDHEIDVAQGFVDSETMDFVFGVFLEIGIEVGKSAPKGQMASRVLVKQGVVEEQAGVVDGGIVGHQGAFAKVGAPFVEG